METRKIIGFGKSSFVVSLPQPWMEKHNLKKGDMVYVKEQLNDLMLSPGSVTETKEPVEIRINVDGKGFDYLKREIISAYINDYNIMYLHGNELKQKAKGLRQILHGLVALEIMEETSEKIMAKDFLNISDISIISILRKVDIIVRSMIIDSKICFEEPQSENLDSRDDDVNRLVFLLFRIVKTSFRNPYLMDRKNSTKDNLIDLLNAWNLAFNMEKIADQIKRLSRIMPQIKLKKQDQNRIIDVYSKVEKLYLDTMKAYYNKDRELAYKISDERKKVMADIDEFFEPLTDQPIAYDIMDKMKGMVSSIHTITRIGYE